MKLWDTVYEPLGVVCFNTGKLFKMPKDINEETDQISLCVDLYS